MAIAGYCGGPRNASFDAALADWAEAYADQNGQDYLRFLQAIGSGRLPVGREV